DYLGNVERVSSRVEHEQGTHKDGHGREPALGCSAGDADIMCGDSHDHEANMSWFCVKIIPADKPDPQDFPLSFAIRHSDFGPSFPCWPAGGITVNLVVMTHSLLRKV